MLEPDRYTKTLTPVTPQCIPCAHERTRDVLRRSRSSSSSSSSSRSPKRKRESSGPSSFAALAAKLGQTAAARGGARGFAGAGSMRTGSVGRGKAATLPAWMTRAQAKKKNE